MASLRQLLASYSPLLVIDAASARIQVGVLHRTQPARWTTSEDEAGVGIFRCIERLAFPPADAGAFVFCDGPGSVLGIRTSAMALRTWNVLTPRALFAYHSLAVVAASLDRPNVTVIADARRESWHAISKGPALRRIPVGELAGDLAMPEGFRHWSSLPAGVTMTPYSLDDLLPRVIDADLFRATEAPDAFLHEEPNYAAWTPQIHRAP